MKSVVIIQARMGSSRFPGKVLADLGGKTVIQHVVSRCAMSSADEVVVATTNHPGDAAIVQWCDSHGVSRVLYGGPADDVLSRYAYVASEISADVVIRVCCDCPFINPDWIDRLLDNYSEQPANYIAYMLRDGKPAILSRVGMPELITAVGLRSAVQFRHDMSEHVTWAFYVSYAEKPRWIPCLIDANEQNTIDTPEDLERLQCRCNLGVA